MREIEKPKKETKKILIMKPSSMRTNIEKAKRRHLQEIFNGGGGGGFTGKLLNLHLWNKIHGRLHATLPILEVNSNCMHSKPLPCVINTWLSWHTQIIIIYWQREGIFKSSTDEGSLLESCINIAWPRCCCLRPFRCVVFSHFDVFLLKTWIARFSYLFPWHNGSGYLILLLYIQAVQWGKTKLSNLEPHFAKKTTNIDNQNSMSW